MHASGYSRKDASGERTIHLSSFTVYSQHIHTAVQVSVMIPSGGDVLVTCTLPATVRRTKAVSASSQCIHSLFTIYS
jgi:hypothetical protein